MVYWEENHRFCNATRCIAGKKIKGRGGGKSKATQLYTPLNSCSLSPLFLPSQRYTFMVWKQTIIKTREKSLVRLIFWQFPLLQVLDRESGINVSQFHEQRMKKAKRNPITTASACSRESNACTAQRAQNWKCARGIACANLRAWDSVRETACFRSQARERVRETAHAWQRALRWLHPALLWTYTFMFVLW